MGKPLSGEFRQIAAYGRAVSCSLTQGRNYGESFNVKMAVRTVPWGCFVTLLALVACGCRFLRVLCPKREVTLIAQRHF